jgi:hypothetical protein
MFQKNRDWLGKMFFAERVDRLLRRGGEHKTPSGSAEVLSFHWMIRLETSKSPFPTSRVPWRVVRPVMVSKLLSYPPLGLQELSLALAGETI